MAEMDKELKNTLVAIEKAFGKNAVMTLTGANDEEIVGISTGSLALDIALGGKGLPRGRIIEIYGNESSGKSTLALHAVANAQKEGGVAAYIDAEHALDPSWARRLGVNLDELLVSQPSNGEEGLKIVEMLVKSNAVDVIVVDSVAALVPRNEIEGEIGDSHVGLQARLMSQALRILNPVIAKTKTCIIFINQLRQKVGVFFGSPETTPGGLALKFYASVRMEVKRGPQIKVSDETVGTEVKVKVVKNKVAPPFRNADFYLLYESGISYESDLLNLGLAAGFISKSGAFFSYGDQRIGQGEEKSRIFLRDNPTIAAELRTKILEYHKLNPDAMPVNASIQDLAEAAEQEIEPVEDAAPTPKRKKKEPKE